MVILPIVRVQTTGCQNCLQQRAAAAITAAALTGTTSSATIVAAAMAISPDQILLTVVANNSHIIVVAFTVAIEDIMGTGNNTINSNRIIGIHNRACGNRIIQVKQCHIQFRLNISHINIPFRS